MLAAVNNALVINKEGRNIYKFCVSQAIVFSLKNVVAVFVSLLYSLASASIIS